MATLLINGLKKYRAWQSSVSIAQTPVVILDKACKPIATVTHFASDNKFKLILLNTAT